MTLSSSLLKVVGADTDAAILSLITCLFTFLFCKGECHFILRFQSGLRLCEYSTDRCLPALNPKSYPLSLPFSCNPTPPHPTLTPHFPTAKSPLSVAAPSSGHRPLGCLCVLVR